MGYLTQMKATNILIMINPVTTMQNYPLANASLKLQDGQSHKR